MASVEGNSSRNCASETPACPATSASPIDSKRSSAKSARNAAMIFSRSVVGAVGAAALAGRGALAADLRAGLRAMNELLLIELLLSELLLSELLLSELLHERRNV